MESLYHPPTRCPAATWPKPGSPAPAHPTGPPRTEPPCRPRCTPCRTREMPASPDQGQAPHACQSPAPAGGDSGPPRRSGVPCGDRPPGLGHSRRCDRRSATYLVIRSCERWGMSFSLLRAAARTPARNWSAGRAEPDRGFSGLAKACSRGSSECCRWRSGRPRRAVSKRSSHSCWSPLVGRHRGSGSSVLLRAGGGRADSGARGRRARTIHRSSAPRAGSSSADSSDKTGRQRSTSSAMAPVPHHHNQTGSFAPRLMSKTRFSLRDGAQGGAGLAAPVRRILGGRLGAAVCRSADPYGP